MQWWFLSLAVSCCDFHSFKVRGWLLPVACYTCNKREVEVGTLM